MLFFVELDVDDALDAVAADYGRNANVHTFNADFAVTVCCARQNALLVFEVSFSHFDSRSCRCVECGASFQQANDLCAAVTGALNDCVQFVLSGPAHLYQIRERDTANGRVTNRRNHGVAVAAENECSNVFHGDVEFGREEVAETSRVKNASHADDFLGGQARELLQSPNHRVERVGDADYKCVRCVSFDAFANRFHNFEVDAQQVVTGHARLAGNTSSYDYNVCASDVSVVVRAFESAVKAFRRAGFSDVEGFALRGAFCDVEENNITEFLDRCEVGEGATDLASADKGNLGSSHFSVLDRGCGRRKG